MPNILRTCAGLFLLLCLPAAAAAETLPQFAFPVDCVLGENCWTVNYVDTNPDENAHSDFLCRNKTYEAHKGVDFAIRNRRVMEEGVDVLAARDGKILRVRDGESDTAKTEEEYSAINAAKRDCGNGVLIDHGQGLQSFYCHLKNGSLKVKPGDEVKEGDVIAQIGQSGFSEFPHLHISIIWEGGHIDPFTGMTMADGCGKFRDNMWKDDLRYEPFTLFDGGFRDHVPDFAAIREGQESPRQLSTGSPALVYWAGFYHARTGDQINMTVRGPDGSVFVERDITLDYNRKRPSFYYTGRKLEDRALKPGTYTGITTFKREGHRDFTRVHEIEIR